MGIGEAIIAFVVVISVGTFAVPMAGVTGYLLGNAEVIWRGTAIRVVVSAVPVPVLIFLLASISMWEDQTSGPMSLRGLIGSVLFMEGILAIFLGPLMVLAFVIGLFFGKRSFRQARQYGNIPREENS